MGKKLKKQAQWHGLFQGLIWQFLIDYFLFFSTVNENLLSVCLSKNLVIEPIFLAELRIQRVIEKCVIMLHHKILTKPKSLRRLDMIWFWIIQWTLQIHSRLTRISFFHHGKPKFRLRVQFSTGFQVPNYTLLYSGSYLLSAYFMDAKLIVR